jgi:histidinol-phosphate aminotransferase
VKTSTRLQSLLRPELAEFPAYRSARSQAPPSDAVFLDANENTLAGAQPGLCRYPDPLQNDLRGAVGQLRDVETSRVFIGNGSDEGIDLLQRAFCIPGRDTILVQPPTYGMYETFARLNGVGVLRVPLDASFAIDVDRVVRELQPTTKLLFVCSPNNPTGTCADRNAVRALLEGTDGLVVVDEAYVDFCAEESWLPELERYDNLVILQTLSKAWGAAGIRVGMLFAHPDIVSLLQRIKPPYNVSGVSQSIAVDLLAGESRMRRTVQRVVHQRNKLAQALATCPDVVRVHPSAANFLLVQFRDPTVIRQHLLREGIVVRDRSDMQGCEGCLRITVGNERDNSMLMDALRAREVV